MCFDRKGRDERISWLEKAVLHGKLRSQEARGDYDSSEKSFAKSRRLGLQGSVQRVENCDVVV